MITRSLRHRNVLVAMLMLAASAMAWLGGTPIPAESVDTRAALVDGSLDAPQRVLALPRDRRVTVTLEIDATGRPVRVMLPADAGLDDEQAARLREFLLSARFTPARHRGRAVATLERVEVDAAMSGLRFAGLSAPTRTR